MSKERKEKKQKTDKQIEELAELEHIRWCRFYFVNHWTYSAKRDNSMRRHNLLVPYEELSLEEQAKDGIFSDVLRVEIDKLA